jgi:Tol biopolymer transport system component
MIQDWPSGTARSLRPSLAVLNGLSPRWAPDSQSVIISGWDTLREGPPDYFRVDVQTSETTPVLTRRGGFSQLSTDGRALLFVDSRRGIVAHDIETGKETIVVAKGARSAIYKFGVSPDGLWVGFLSQPGGEGEGLALELQPRGGPARRLLTATSPATLEFQAWMPDSRSLLISRSTVGANKPDQLWRIAVTGEPQDLHFAVSRAVNQVSLSRDGSRLAYTEKNPFLELWINQNVLSPEGARK